MSFNPSQREAIRHKDGPMLVLAGPGSGKTLVITERTRHLITEYGINPANILVITFTRAAATEMKERFLRLMGGKSSAVTFGTFHAVFFMILKHAYHYQAENIIREEQRVSCMREIIKRHRLEYEDESEFIAALLGGDRSSEKQRNFTRSLLFHELRGRGVPESLQRVPRISLCASSD